MISICDKLKFKNDIARDSNHYTTLNKMYQGVRKTLPGAAALANNYVFDTSKKMSLYLIIFAFTNCTFNLRTRERQETDKYDMVLLNSGKPWIEPTDELVHEVDCFFKSILDDPEALKTFLSMLRSTLTNWKPERFWILTGEGRNGKGASMEMVTNLLGDEYAYQGATTSLTREFKEGPNEALFQMHKKTFVRFVEPESSACESIRSNNIRNLSGDQTINANGKWKSGKNSCKTSLKATFCCDCNKLPLISGDTSGESLQQRLVVIDFPFTFTDREDQLKSDPAKYKPLNKKYKEGFAETHRCALFKYIIESGDFKEIYVAERCRNRALAHIDRSNVVSEFVQTRFIHDPNEEERHFLPIKLIHSEFVKSDTYANLSRKERERYKLKDINEEVKKAHAIRQYYREAKKVSVGPEGKFNTQQGMLHWRLRVDEDDEEPDVSPEEGAQAGGHGEAPQGAAPEGAAPEGAATHGDAAAAHGEAAATQGEAAAHGEAATQGEAAAHGEAAVHEEVYERGDFEQNFDY